MAACERQPVAFAAATDARVVQLLVESAAVLLELDACRERWLVT